MKLLLSSLLLFCYSSAQNVSSHTRVVSQSPDVSVLEGETVNISCCWKGTDPRVGIRWLKNQSYIKTNTILYQSKDSLNKQGNDCSFLILTSISSKDSGRYICKVSVEIPVLSETEGNGTTITVIATEKTTTEATTKRRTDTTTNTKTKKTKTSKAITKATRKTTTKATTEISKADQDDILPFVMRCLPILALITAFFWLYYIGTRAEKNSSGSADGNISIQSREEEQGEDEDLGEHEGGDKGEDEVHEGARKKVQRPC